MLDRPIGKEYGPYRCSCPSTKPLKCPACKAWERKPKRSLALSHIESRSWSKPAGTRPKADITILQVSHAAIEQSIQQGTPYVTLARFYSVGIHPFLKYCMETGIYQKRGQGKHPDLSLQANHSLQEKGAA